MKTYAKVGVGYGFYVRVEGVGGNPAGPGTPQEMGPFAARPEPALRWQTEKYNIGGREVTDYTQFEVGGEVAFVLADITFQADSGNSAEYGGEELLAPDHPRAQALTIDQCRQWTGHGWKSCEAPAVLVRSGETP